MSSDALLPAADRPALADARARAIRLLTDRYADDTLGTGEFESRLDRLYGTETPAAVATLVADLEAPVPRQRQAHQTAPALPRPADERLLCIFGERRLDGDWAPGERMEVVAGFAEVVLDLRRARLGARCEIDVQAFCASVQVLLPPEVRLEAYVGPVMGSVEDEVPPPAGDGPVVRVRGFAVMAEVAIRRAPVTLPPDAPFKLAWKEARRAAKRARSR